MGTLVQKLVTADSFDALGKLVKAGQVGAFDEDKLSGDEKHLHDISGEPLPAVQIAAIAPTGPNPTVPQQIPPDALQDASGQYVIPGKRLVGERTLPAEERLTDDLDPELEAKATEELDQIMGAGASTENGDDLVAGTVSDVTADLGSRTDEELDALEAAEKRGKSRTGVLSAIEAERDSRRENQG